MSISPSPATPAIQIDGLTFAYGERVAIDALTLDVPAGAIFGLLGPNGSGKSTLLSLLVGARYPQITQISQIEAAVPEQRRQTIKVLGRELSVETRARVGIVFQEASLDPLMTVGETMALHARLFGVVGETGRAETARLLARVGLADRAAARTSTLSGGMKRRLELARALVPGPALLLLDEPTLALDLDSRRALWDELLAVNAAGVTLLVATNDVDEAERYCTDVALLDEGRLVVCGTPAELKRGLRHDAVRIEWHGDAAQHAEMLRAWEGVGSVRAGSTPDAENVTHVTVDAATPFLARLFEASGADIRGVRIDEASLEDVYFQKVGRGIAGGAS